MFCEILERLHNWERQNIPGPYRGVGIEVLLWLVKEGKRPKLLKDLYLSSRFSEPTVRGCLRGFEDNGYIVIRSSDEDMRARFAIATEKLDHLLREYQKQLAALGRLSEADHADSNGAVGIKAAGVV